MKNKSCRKCFHRDVCIRYVPYKEDVFEHTVVSDDDCQHFSDEREVNVALSAYDLEKIVEYYKE